MGTGIEYGFYAAIASSIVQTAFSTGTGQVFDDRANSLAAYEQAQAQDFLDLWQTYGAPLEGVQAAEAAGAPDCTPIYPVAIARETIGTRLKYADIRAKLINGANVLHAGAEFAKLAEANSYELFELENAVLTGMRMENARIDQNYAIIRDHRYRVSQHLRTIAQDANAASNAAMAAAKAAGAAQARRDNGIGYFLGKAFNPPRKSNAAAKAQDSTTTSKVQNPPPVDYSTAPDQTAAETARLNAVPDTTNQGFAPTISPDSAALGIDSSVGGSDAIADSTASSTAAEAADVSPFIAVDI